MTNPSTSDLELNVEGLDDHANELDERVTRVEKGLDDHANELDERVTRVENTLVEVLDALYGKNVRPVPVPSDDKE